MGNYVVLCYVRSTRYKSGATPANLLMAFTMLVDRDLDAYIGSILDKAVEELQQEDDVIEDYITSVLNKG